MAAAREYDVVVRGGTIADGTGAALFEGDVALRNGQIAAVGRFAGWGKEEISAKGQLVTPGFVDIHTHYDGQVTWESSLSPSSLHGVTSVLMGNCGVGFAPCRPEDRDVLVELMEGVEDIPEAVMTAGLKWDWKSFPSYLNVLAARRSDIDFGAQIPHSPIRVFVMGARGADHEPPTGEDLSQMTDIVAEGIAAGAVGVSSSLSLSHRTRAGKAAPSVFTEVDELVALGLGLRKAGAGVFQISPRTVVDEIDPVVEMANLRRVAEASGRPLSFTLLHRRDRPDQLAQQLGLMDQARQDGVQISAQICSRPLGVLFGLDLSFHPFRFNPSYMAIAHLSLTERVSAMRDPELRARILAERAVHTNPAVLNLIDQVEYLCPLGDPPNYEPAEQDALAARAARLGIPVRELAYELLIANGGKDMLLLPSANYVNHSLEDIRPLLGRDGTLVALGDGGAHYGMVCDSSYPTTMLAYWARDRKRGPLIDLATAVRTLSRDPARAVGFADRGMIAPGYKADLNIIDHDRLRLHAPYTKADLPAGGCRLHQSATGYTATIVSGAITYRDGQATGARPGRLIRGFAAAKAPRHG